MLRSGFKREAAALSLRAEASDWRDDVAGGMQGARRSRPRRIHVSRDPIPPRILYTRRASTTGDATAIARADARARRSGGTRRPRRATLAVHRHAQRRRSFFAQRAASLGRPTTRCSTTPRFGSAPAAASEGRTGVDASRTRRAPTAPRSGACHRRHRRHRRPASKRPPTRRGAEARSHAGRAGRKKSASFQASCWRRAPSHGDTPTSERPYAARRRRVDYRRHHIDARCRW